MSNTKDQIRDALQDLLFQVEQFCARHGEADFDTARARAALQSRAPVLFNPYNGQPRDVRDVQSDPQGTLIVPPGAMLQAATAPRPQGDAREAFEAFYGPHRGSAFLDWSESLGRYKWDSTQEAWLVWQAATAQASEPSAELTVIDPEQWEPCSPAWLNAGGNCAAAPRLWHAASCNHWHPKAAPAQASAPVPIGYVHPQAFKRLEAGETVAIRQKSYDDPNQLAVYVAAPARPVALPPIVAEILAELDRATRKFPTWPTDPLHALAVLGEEFGELTKDALQLTYEPHKTNAANVKKEAMQTAAMALRLAMSLERYEYTPCAQHSQQDGITTTPAKN